MRWLILTALLLVPAGAATYTPALYFLAPSEDPILGAGSLTLLQPTGNESANAVLVPLGEVPGATFIALESPNATHILGRVLVGLWMDPGIAQGAVEARILVVDPAGAITEISRSALPVSTDPNALPEPTTLLPPDPTDPQAAVYHMAAKLLPLLNRPPMLLDLGILNVEVPEGAIASIELRLIADNTTEMPAAGLARIAYDAALTPSFVYVSWWSPNPVVAPAPGATPTQPGSSDPSAPIGKDPNEPSGPSSDAGKDSPGLAIPVGLLALTATAMVLRRRS